LTHPVGKSKARFYHLHGFTEKSTEFLKNELLEIAYNKKVQMTENTAYGIKYIIEGSVRTPKGRTIEIRTIWIIETNDENPRLVTAYPAQ
jgi:TolB-like protein